MYIKSMSVSVKLTRTIDILVVQSSLRVDMMTHVTFFSLKAAAVVQKAPGHFMTIMHALLYRLIGL